MITKRRIRKKMFKLSWPTLRAIPILC